jgi:hypothetical protein
MGVMLVMRWRIVINEYGYICIAIFRVEYNKRFQFAYVSFVRYIHQNFAPLTEML